jgi:4-carboxymuconolactone decarboxylase
MARLAPLSPERMSAEQRQVLDETNARGLPVGGPYIAYLRSPKFMALNRDMGDFLRHSSLPGRLRQLMVMRTIKHWNAKYPWWAQTRRSLAEGLEQAALDAIAKGQPPTLSDPKEQIAFKVSEELVTSGQLSDATYQRAHELLGETSLVEAVATCGFFTMVCFTANAFQVDPPSN